MREEWVNPAFDEIVLCGECTAYAGAASEKDRTAEPDASAAGTAQTLSGLCLSTHPDLGTLE